MLKCVFKERVVAGASHNFTCLLCKVVCRHELERQRVTAAHTSIHTHTRLQVLAERSNRERHRCIGNERRQTSHSHARHGCSVPAERADCLARLCVPHKHAPIKRTTHNPCPIATHRHRSHRSCVTAVLLRLLLLFLLLLLLLLC